MAKKKGWRELTMGGKLACSQCGQCCKNVALSESPKKLKEYFKTWLKSRPKEKVTDIWLLYPMLKPKGFDKKVKKWRYSCVHLKKEGDVFKCGIYSMRPYMCKDFGSVAIRTGVPDRASRKLYPKCSLV